MAYLGKVRDTLLFQLNLWLYLWIVSNPKFIRIMPDLPTLFTHNIYVYTISENGCEVGRGRDTIRVAGIAQSRWRQSYR